MLALVTSILELEGKTIKAVLNINDDRMIAFITTDGHCLLIHAHNQQLRRQESLSKEQLEELEAAANRFTPAG